MLLCWFPDHVDGLPRARSHSNHTTDIYCPRNHLGSYVDPNADAGLDFIRSSQCEMVKINLDSFVPRRYSIAKTVAYRYEPGSFETVHSDCIIYEK
jgi:hypothetical protein